MQLVVRPDDEFRGYAGQIASGMIRVGDPVTVWPAGRTTRVKRIVTWDGDLDEAFAPMSVTLVLEDEHRHQPRGRRSRPAASRSANRFTREVVWMDERAARSARGPTC